MGTAKRLHKVSVEDLIEDEVEAVESYDKAIDESDDSEEIATYEHIKDEEKEHIEELEELGKMKAEDITSEQAWEDFKNSYAEFKERHIDKDRDGSHASLEEKINILTAKISELNTDMARLGDSVPQALGVIEENKTLEEEVKEVEESDKEDDEFFEGDDGLDEYFTDLDEEDESDSDESESDSKEAPKKSDENVESDEDYAEDDEETDAESDEDYIPIDGDDEDTDDAEADDAEDDEDYVPIDDEDEDSDDEIIEKMISVLEKMDRRISHLERENEGLKKMLSTKETVPILSPSLTKSRPTPNTNLRMVKGSYNRPPVSTQHVANQRDIGMSKASAGDSSESLFAKRLNEVFEECDRIAHQERY